MGFNTPPLGAVIAGGAGFVPPYTQRFLSEIFDTQQLAAGRFIEGTDTLTGGTNGHGIHVPRTPDAATLVIGGTGTLFANGGANDTAGIGGNA